MKENNIPASDRPRVNSAFAKARQERARANDWVQLDDGQWVQKAVTVARMRTDPRSPSLLAPRAPSRRACR